MPLENKLQLDSLGALSFGTYLDVISQLVLDIFPFHGVHDEENLTLNYCFVAFSTYKNKDKVFPFYLMVALCRLHTG